MKINHSLTFDNFKIGKYNEFAYVAVTNYISYSIVVIYGESGAGKTHLLNALANEVQNNILSMHYMDMDEFTKMMSNKNNKLYIEQYSSYELLIIENLQKIPSDNKIQHTLKSIIEKRIENGKHTIVSSQTNPSELDGLDESLEWILNDGITTNIIAPQNIG
ncbi:MAG: ATP-binding protein [Butyrivibrio sp.]|nr:ATP-binding protein [Butyrivibrio sp.]